MNRDANLKTALPLSQREACTLEIKHKQQASQKHHRQAK